MPLRSLPFIAACIIAVLGSPHSDASETATRQIVVTAHFGSRTSLEVSTRLLRFDVPASGEPATVAVDFSAGTRTASGAEVVLFVEALRATDGNGDAADVDTAISFSGIGQGTLSGVLVPTRPSIAARWTGSGFRTGRLVFALQGPAPGIYAVPVRFVLAAP